LCQMSRSLAHRPSLKVRLKIQFIEKMGIDNTLNSKLDYVDLVNLIRSIQRAEGNLDCYRTGRQQCERMNCVWRDHCLTETRGASMADDY
jgi:hypothetical protein